VFVVAIGQPPCQKVRNLKLPTSRGNRNVVC
jgi:hypothetical protein